VIEKLKTYVYRLVDPRDGETFYVGKGKGNRVFAHIHGEQGMEGDDLDNKMKRIRAIRIAGFEVATGSTGTTPPKRISARMSASESPMNTESVARPTRSNTRRGISTMKPAPAHR